ncbi:zinc-binding dehydrogenase [Chloroflexi bacterium TSY]|nr:zinc-binding dehydrogenase [Chloroflexi bacterium TSY]
MKGRIAVLTKYFGPFEIREYDVPDPEPGAILVRLTTTGLCGSDLHIWRGELDQAFPLEVSGSVIGHEMAGRVDKLGAGVTTDSLGNPLAEGDRIVYSYFYPCGRCPICLDGHAAACPNKRRGSRSADDWPHFKAGYADFYYLRPDHFVYKVSSELTDELLTPVNCALAQVVYGLNKIGLRFGDAVVIQGAGGLGLNATAVAREMGADKVIVIDQFDGRLQLARQFGATHTVSLADYQTDQQRIEAVKDLTGGWGADVVCDFVGFPQVALEGLQMLRNGGAYLEIGNISPGNKAQIDLSDLVHRNIRIQGVLQYDPRMIPKALSFLEKTRSKYPFDDIISHTYKLEQINDAFEQAEWLQRESDPTKVVRANIVP